MSKNISHLYAVANKKERLIIGLMSGTSLDGLDVALCKIGGSGTDTQLELSVFETVAYSPAFKQEVRSVFSKRNVDLEKVCLLNAWIGEQHATIILSCLAKWSISAAEIDIIASHGQTIYHAPKKLHQLTQFSNATLQIGDGDHLAVKTGIITVSDFRQKHIAAGGEGAPLAAYGDYLIFSKKNENRIMLNIGGIANFTYLPGNLDAKAVFCTDTGPGNTLMDAYIQQHFPGKYFDEGSEIAKQGSIHNSLLKALEDNIFFKGSFPKTTGPELFNLAYVENAMQKAGIANISHYDMMATLNRFTADTVSQAVKAASKNINNFTIYIYTSGGGIHNPLLMRHLQQLLPGCVFKDTSSLHINPDAKEAVLFAILANECICGESTGFEGSQYGIPCVTMGKISFPW